MKSRHRGEVGCDRMIIILGFYIFVTRYGQDNKFLHVQIVENNLFIINNAI